MERARTVVVTGGASGIGLAVRHELERGGHNVVAVDRAGGHIDANLADDDERQRAVDAIAERYPSGIDAAICCAGIGGMPDRGSEVTAINFFGTTRFLDRLRTLLLPSPSPRVVVTSSVMAVHPPDHRLLELMLANNEAAAAAHTNETMTSYITGKRALCHWVRRQAITPEWAGSGILLNGIAPGTIRTPMTNAALASPQRSAAAAKAAPIALADYPMAESIAPLIAFLAGPGNAYMVGQTIFADGGSEVLLRGDVLR